MMPTVENQIEVTWNMNSKLLSLSMYIYIYLCVYTICVYIYIHIHMHSTIDNTRKDADDSGILVMFGIRVSEFKN